MKVILSTAVYAVTVLDGPTEQGLTAATDIVISVHAGKPVIVYDKGK